MRTAAVREQNLVEAVAWRTGIRGEGNGTDDLAACLRVHPRV
jgi:hypothetical protein